MAKISKEGFTKQEWKAFQKQRRADKEQKRLAKWQKELNSRENQTLTTNQHNIAFVLGNGTSRKSVDPNDLKKLGVVYGCNALYRDFSPDYLVAVDVKMILEINKQGYQKKHEVWTNPNRAYDRMVGFNFFQPSKGWSSGPTALWLASQHRYNKIYILGFDYRGLQNGKQFNNIYANTPNYKKSTDGATFFGNWLRQTKSVIQENRQIRYIRVIEKDDYCPDELNKLENFVTQPLNDFKQHFVIN